ncbi:hypothetical protein Zmor_013120 [Zophobas morio]|uniref:Uncharacterized protein n=1 Tax=Zophobas morio TaxID=2755281 RepID=A0AA38IH54_9CUCU|nr:hypothetical protein Zmor_013120 [Zophobas morio]
MDVRRISTKPRKYRLARDIYRYRVPEFHMGVYGRPSRLTTSVGTLNIVTNIPDVQEPSDSIYAPVINSDPFGRLQRTRTGRGLSLRAKSALLRSLPATAAFTGRRPTRDEKRGLN